MSVGIASSTTFIDDAGLPRRISDLVVVGPDGPGYSKVVTKVKTPKVRV
jgi:hypothetical protein